MNSFKYLAVLPLSTLISSPSMAGELGTYCWQQQPVNNTFCFSVNQINEQYFSLVGEVTTPDAASTPVHGLAVVDEANQLIRATLTQNLGTSLVFGTPLQINSLTLNGVWQSNNGDRGDFVYLGKKPDSPENTNEPFTLGIFHINDHHSHLSANTAASLTFNGQATTVEMGGFPRVATKIKERAPHYQNVLKLHAGDATTGSLYHTLFKGGADVALMNQICFDAFTPGSHEFDEGDAGLKEFLDTLNSGDGANVCTATLAANIVPKVGVSPLAPNTPTDYLKPYVIKQFGEIQVGIIGITDAQKTQNSSRPDPTTEFLDETTTAQRYIDELTHQGINKIVLLTHYGYENDLTLAKQLSGVDVIIGGDSHTLLGNNLTQFGLKSQGAYPAETTDKDGNLVCVAHAWEYAQVLGELSVSFSNEGKVANCGGTPHVLLGNTFKRNGAELTDNVREEVLNLINTTPELSVVEPDSGAAVWVNYADMFVGALMGTKIGQATENLCLERIPGQGRSQICEVSATRAHGSDVAQLVALAFKERSKRADLAIQNGGGVRADLPMGDITIGTAYTLLPFANTLVNLDLTGAELVAVLEDALDFTLASSSNSGAYPYASGLRWTVDLSKPKGKRFSNVQVKLKADSDWVAIDLARTYVVVTSDFLASGKDGYQTFATVSADPKKVEMTSLEYAQSFIDYVESVGTVSKLPVSEYSTQQFYDATGQLQN